MRSGCSGLGTSERSVDLNAGEMYTPVQTPESGVVMVARMPFCCRIARCRWCLAIRLHCERLYADAREMDIPRAKHRMRRNSVFPRARGARKTRAI